MSHHSKIDFEPGHAPLRFDLRRRHLLQALALALLPACGREAPESSPEPRTRTAPVRAVDDPNFRVSTMHLPGLIDAADQGAFIALLRAIDDAYPAGRLDISLYPEARAIKTLVDGDSDLVFPLLRESEAAAAKLPYRFSTESFGKVSFVLYSHVDRKWRRNDVDKAIAQNSPLTLIGPQELGIPVQQFNGFEAAFARIDAGRVDGLLWAQEEADAVLRESGRNSIHRSHFADYDDVFAVARNPRGDFVDLTLSAIIRTLRGGGRLASLYQAVHQNYNDWQPGRG